MKVARVHTQEPSSLDVMLYEPLIPIFHLGVRLMELLNVTSWLMDFIELTGTGKNAISTNGTNKKNQRSMELRNPQIPRVITHIPAGVIHPAACRSWLPAEIKAWCRVFPFPTLELAAVQPPTGHGAASGAFCPNQFITSPAVRPRLIGSKMALAVMFTFQTKYPTRKAAPLLNRNESARKL